MKFDKNGFVRCRVCGCTEIEPCDPPCSWAEGDLCSNCASTVQALLYWKDAALHPSVAALMREVKQSTLESRFHYGQMAKAKNQLKRKVARR